MRLMLWTLGVAAVGAILGAKDAVICPADVLEGALIGGFTGLLVGVLATPTRVVDLHFPAWRPRNDRKRPGARVDTRGLTEGLAVSRR
jgi:uncharacterized membrane protein YfcA